MSNEDNDKYLEEVFENEEDVDDLKDRISKLVDPIDKCKVPML